MVNDWDESALSVFSVCVCVYMVLLYRCCCFVFGFSVSLGYLSVVNASWSIALLFVSTLPDMKLLIEQCSSG